MIDLIGPPLLLIIAFLLGSIPWGWLVARAYGEDIQKLGSGNIGMTNVWRTLGWKPGLLVFVLDTLKGLLAAFIGIWWARVGMSERLSAYPDALQASMLVAGMIYGLAAVIGHTFTPWLRFKGGKGVATALGVFLAVYQVWILIPLSVFMLALIATRMVSLSSLLAGAVLGALPFFLPSLFVLRWFGLVVFLLVLYTHRSNIRRILNGTENKVSFRRKPSST